MQPPRFPGAARAIPLAAAGLLLLAAPGGCSFPSPREVLTGPDVSLSFEPSPGSAAFRELHLEKTPSIVVLKVDGDDIRANMTNISQALLAKGYAVRDYFATLEDLGRADLLRREALDPELLKKAAGLFAERAAIVGTIQVAQLEPLRVHLVLRWVDLKSQKTLWTARASYAAYAFGGQERYDAAVRDMVEKVLSVLPRAAP